MNLEPTLLDEPTEEYRRLTKTDPEIERRIVEHARRCTPAQKLDNVIQLNKTLEMLAMTDVRQRHPDATEQECRMYVASRRIPAEMMLKAYGWDVKLKGY